MSNYLINGVSIVAPSGTITSYLGTSDPPGWLICDGISRTATITNEFATLATILNNSLSPTTQNTSSSVTPPNLQGNFLQGSSSATQGQSTTGGASTVTLTTNNMPSHTHTITGSATTTATFNSDLATSITNGTGFLIDKNDWESGPSSGAYTGWNNIHYPSAPAVLTATTTIGKNGSISATTTLSALSASNTGNNTAFSILPPYLTVNYIIKI